MSQQMDYAPASGDINADIDIKPLIEPVATALIVVAIVLFAVAFLGFCGACCDSRLILALVSLLPIYTI